MIQFDWDKEKDIYNEKEHHVSFEEAQMAFFDPNRLIVFDEKHSTDEKRWYCVGKVENRII